MIELLIVVSLIVILTTMGMTQYRHSVIYAREGVLKEDLFRLRDAIDQYYRRQRHVPEHAGCAHQRGLRAEAARPIPFT
jgi:general secretion pathway protein G